MTTNMTTTNATAANATPSIANANEATRSLTRANALGEVAIVPDAAVTGAVTDPTDGPVACPNDGPDGYPIDAPDHRAAVARTIGEALRLAGAIEAMSIERVVAGTDAEYDLAVRLNDLTERLAYYADGGDLAAGLVRRHLTPLVARLETAAMDEALATTNALVGRGGPVSDDSSASAPCGDAPRSAVPDRANVVAFPLRPRGGDTPRSPDTGEVR